MLVSAALAGYSASEQTKILKSLEEGTTLPTKRLNEGRAKVEEVFEAWEPTVEGYAGFPIDRETVQKKKASTDDRNVGRVVQHGGSSFVITGKKSDGRYIVVGKGGEKTAKDPADIGLQTNEQFNNSVDIEDLHVQMLEGLKQARKNVGASTCWDGYKAKGTKTKNGKEVPNCVKEEEVEEGYKPIDKKKETKMYRRAGNLSRDALSKGMSTKAGSAAQDKSTKIVSAISRQKEKERFAKMGDEKARDNYKEEVEEVSEAGMHRDAKTGEVVNKAEVGKTYYPNMPKRKSSVALRKEKEAMKKEEVEQVDELYKGKHGQTDKQYADSRSDAGKMVSGDSKMSGAEYTHGRRVKAANPGMQPDVGGKTKPKSQGKMDKGSRADLQYRKANLKKKNEEFINKLSASGLFTEAELRAMGEME